MTPHPCCRCLPPCFLPPSLLYHLPPHPTWPFGRAAVTGARARADRSGKKRSANNGWTTDDWRRGHLRSRHPVASRVPATMPDSSVTPSVRTARAVRDVPKARRSSVACEPPHPLPSAEPTLRPADQPKNKTSSRPTCVCGLASDSAHACSHAMHNSAALHHTNNSYSLSGDVIHLLAGALHGIRAVVC